MLTDAELSRLMFAARETIGQYAELVGELHPRESASKRALALCGEIDAYRVSRGWDPNGFGGE